MTTQPSQRTGALAGIRVLDLTSVVLGPLATQILGDYGADIIKVEGPDGDICRSTGTSRHPGMSSIFLALNRNKRSIAIDLKTTEGVAAVRRLLPSVDVFVHNMRVDAIERLGLGYEAVAATNPGLVYCVATGFGQDGPDARKPAFDDVIQGACGLASLLGHEAGGAEFAPSLIADKTVGMALVNAVLAALLYRARGGKGQYVEVPMLETMATFVLAEHLGGLTFDPPAGDVGYARILAGGRRPAPTRDGFVTLLPYTGAHWTTLFEYNKREDLKQKYDVFNPHERNSRIRELYADLHQITRQMTSAECLEMCRKLDLPASPIYTLQDLPEHPHLKAVGLFQKGEHPTEGQIVSMRSPTRFFGTPAELALPAPTLGQQTEEILRESGLKEAEIAALVQRGIVRSATVKSSIVQGKEELTA